MDAAVRSAISERPASAAGAAAGAGAGAGAGLSSDFLPIKARVSPPMIYPKVDS